MNDEFVFDDAELPASSSRDMLIITIGGIVSGILAIFLVTPDRRVFELSLVMSSINIMSMTFSTGLFSFLTAGILFNSLTSRQYLLRRIKLVGERRAYLVRLLHAIMVASIFTIVMTIVSFLIPIMLNWYPTLPVNFSAIPSVLLASLIVSACLVTIASFVASLTDDSRLSVLLGCTAMMIIANTAGWSSDVFIYSLTRNFAIMSPHNLVKGFTVLLNGYPFESSNQMVEYVGFVVSAQGIAVSLLLMVSLSIVSLIIGIRALRINSGRWQFLPGLIPLHEAWSSAATNEEIRRTKRSLRLQRGLTTIIIALLLVSINISGSAYVADLQSSTTIVHYESPENGEILQVGVWLMIDIDVQPPVPGLFNMIFFQQHVLDWGNTSGTVTFYYDILDMNSVEFSALNESSRLDMVFGDRTVDTDSHVGHGIGHNIEEAYGAYVCVLKVVSVTDPLVNSYLNVSLFVEQSGI